MITSDNSGDNNAVEELRQLILAWHHAARNGVRLRRWPDGHATNETVRNASATLSMIPPDQVPISAVPALIAQLAAYQAQLAMRLASTATVSEPVTIADPEDQMLTVKQVAARLNLSVKSVYRKAKYWPFARQIDGSWRFSQRGLERWLARQKV